MLICMCYLYCSSLVVYINHSLELVVENRAAQVNRKWNLIVTLLNMDIKVLIAFSYLLYRLQPQQVCSFNINSYMVLDQSLRMKRKKVLIIWYAPVILIFSIRYPHICVLYNVQDHDSPMDQGLWGQLIQDHSRCPKLAQQPHCFCHIWSKYSNGFYKLSVPKQHVHIQSWGSG